VFSHGLLFSGAMFEAQVDHFKDSYRCVTYDHRGQGGSEVTDDGYDMDTLTGDAIALIEELGIGPCHFAGLSMGGFVGLRIAIRRPDLIKSLILIETTADPEPEENKPKYRKLNRVARWFGLGMVIKKVMPIMFSQSFLNAYSREDEQKLWRDRIVANDRVGITRAVTGVIDRQGVYEQLGKIDTPTLIIVGEEDVATVPEKSERMRAAIRGAKLVRIPRAGHSSTIEEPAAVNAAIEDFLARLT
jgi:pimeloyl-ACP methyl ester carboxylesterase